MAYDPIINYYDEPGGPHWPSKNGGGGGGGGGGEATLGSMWPPMRFVHYQPTIGESMTDDIDIQISDIYVGSQHVLGPGSAEFEGHPYDVYNMIGTVASGARVTYVRSLEVPTGATVDVHMYVVTTEVEDAGTPDESENYTSVRELDVEPSIVIGEHSGPIFITITQPEIDSDAGEILVCYVEADGQPV